MPWDEHLGCPAVRLFRDGMLPVTVPVLPEDIFVGNHRVHDALPEGEREVVAGAALAVVIHHEVHTVYGAVLVALGALAGTGRGSVLAAVERYRQAIGGGK